MANKLVHMLFDMVISTWVNVYSIFCYMCEQSMQRAYSPPTWLAASRKHGRCYIRCSVPDKTH